MASEREDPEDDLRKTMRISVRRGGVDEDTPTLSRPVSAVQRSRPPRAPARDNGPSTPLRTGESAGRANAFYAPARPHAVPAAHSPAEDPHAPAVIINDEVDEKTLPDMPSVSPLVHDTLPGGDELDTTLPLANAVPHRPARPAGPMAGRRDSSLDRTQILPRAKAARSMHKTTVILKKGPSSRDKWLAFVGVLILTTACGIAVVAWKKPEWFGIGKPGAERAPSSVKTTSTASPAPKSSGAVVSPSNELAD